MRIDIIFYLIIFFSLIGLGIIVYRKIPVLANLSEDEMSILNRKKGVMQTVKEVDYKQYWLGLMIFSEKFLRRLKILFLKIENLISKCINGLRNRSDIMAQKSKEWIRQREMKRRIVEKDVSGESEEKISIKITDEESDFQSEEIKEVEIEEDDDLSISELKKPIKEEQKWIDLIVENPKNITAYKFLGLLYWKQHNYIDAKSSLEMSVKLGSKDRKVKEILEELKKIKTE